MRKNVSRRIGFCWLLIVSSHAGAVQNIAWDKSVIKLELIVGVEQLIHFNGPATVGLPSPLADHDVFRHLFTSETAYWKAMRPFRTERVKVRLDDTGDFVLFDVSARTERKPPKSVEPIAIVLPSDESKADMLVQKEAPQDSVTMFDLLRYAAQTDYSPPRVVSAVRGVHALENTINTDLSPLYNHSDNGKVDMFVDEIWGAEGWYVTSIVVRNRTASPVTIDPSKMQHTVRNVVNGASNHFLAAAMLHRVLGPRGGTSTADNSRIYIITDKPFGRVIDL